MNGTPAVSRATTWFLVASIAALGLAFLTIALEQGTLWPWAEIVHESGTRTLLGTVLYYDHALRELPLDLVLGAGVGAAVWAAAPGAAGLERRGPPIPLVVLGATGVLVLAGTWRSGGWPVVAANLAQAPLRVGGAEVWGQHWQYHVVSRLALLALAVPFAVVATGDRPLPGRLRPFGAVLVAFLALTLVFRPTIRSFTDTLFIGHQAREFATHVSVTLPLATVAAVVAVRARGGALLRGIAGMVRDPIVLRLAATGLVLGSALVVGALVTDAQAEGQSDTLAALVGVHFFEHVLSYVAGAAAAAAFAGWLARRDRGSAAA